MGDVIATPGRAPLSPPECTDNGGGRDGGGKAGGGEPGAEPRQHPRRAG